jgi:hypothetical protein
LDGLLGGEVLFSDMADLMSDVSSASTSPHSPLLLQPYSSSPLKLVLAVGNSSHSASGPNSKNVMVGKRSFGGISLKVRESLKPNQLN